MSTGTIDANKKILSKIFSEDFWFLVPEYQRSYVWQTDNITELLDDLYFAFNNKSESEYFLGSLVLKKFKDTSFPEYEVLDGQQRLTTFFIMMAVLRDKVADSKYKDTLHKKIYQEENALESIPSRTRITYKIRDNVEDFIQNYIVKLHGTTYYNELQSKIGNDNVSISNMSNTIIQLHKQFSNMEKICDLEEFIKFIFNKAIFIYVSTENTEDAFRLFTILNNRGIPLTNADILKSQNIGALSNEKEKNKYAKIWEEIESKHGDDFDRFLQFLRTILIQEKARANLLEEFNDKIYQIKASKTPLLRLGEDTLKFVNKYNEIYEKIIELQDENLSNSIKNLLTVMKIGLRSEDWIPPLMHYYAKFGIEKLELFLKKLEFKFTGDWVCGISPTIRLDAMNTILKEIDKTSKQNLNDLLNHKKLFHVDSKQLRENIEGSIYKKQFARHLLLKIEYLSGDNTVHLSNYQYITVEHILPRNPRKNSQWDKNFSKDSRDYWIDRIANLVLISQKKNSALSNHDFVDKKQIYLKKRIDAFSANKVFIEQSSEWTTEVLKKRQSYLIELLSEPI
ncbi:DUF262 domain-containing protein [Paenibacillus sp. TSA_86.1]|uniref:DUF262 domain-containing protein n=1 Tax=Paenibacillus sp. TSA_86.1 TaxID=3415649 RepID=UPI004045525E